MTDPRFIITPEKDATGKPEVLHFGRGSSSLPSVIYKFRNWNQAYHKEILLNSSLFAARATEFNDPFDAKANINFETMFSSKAHFEVVKELISQKYFRKMKRKEQREISRSKEFRKWIEDSTRIANQERANDLMNQIQNHVGIISFTGRRDNILLWGHYADSHKGFCVGFDRDLYFDETLKYAPTYLLKVKYADSFPMIKSFFTQDRIPGDVILDSMINALTIKSTDWHYEQEIRTLLINQPNVNLKFDPNCVKEVVLGCRIPGGDRSEILDICNSGYPNAEIYQASIAPTAFALNFTRIN